MVPSIKVATSPGEQKLNRRRKKQNVLERSSRWGKAGETIPASSGGTVVLSAMLSFRTITLSHQEKAGPVPYPL